MRVVLDVNVLISALLSPTGAPARVLVAWTAGQFELIVSPLLLGELQRALAYPKLRRLIDAADADAFVAWLTRSATVAPDPGGVPPIRALDPGDDYLLALAAAENALLVTGDAQLLALAGDSPIHAPARFLSDFLSQA